MRCGCNDRDTNLQAEMPPDRKLMARLNYWTFGTVANGGKMNVTPLKPSTPRGIMEPTVTTPAATPAPAAAPPTPSAPATPPAAPSSASGPGFSGVASGSGTPNPTPSVPPTTPGFNAASAPAQPAVPAPAAPDFNSQFQQQFGMTRDQAQMLISMGYKTYQGQQTPPAAALQPQPGAAAAQPANPFGLPKFDTGLLSMVGRDPATGQLVNLPGAPPDAAWQVQQYQEKLRDVQTQFWQDPMKFLGDQVKAQVQAEAQRVYEQQFGGFQQQQATDRILQDNSSWLFATDAQGQVQQQFNPATGRMERQLSPYGQFYAQQVQRLVAQGVRDPQAQHEYATQALQNALMIQERQRQQAPAAGAAAGQNFTQQAAANQLPAAPPPSVNLPPAAPGVSLRERMRQNLDANGLSNEVISQQLNRVA